MKHIIQFTWDHEKAEMCCTASQYRIMKEAEKSQLITITEDRRTFPLLHQFTAVLSSVFMTL